MPQNNKLIDHALVIGSEGFLGRYFMDYAHKHGLNWVGFGRSDGDLTDLAVAEQAIKST